MFSSEGDLNPSAKIKLSWGVILAALGYVMILSGNIGAIKIDYCTGLAALCFRGAAISGVPVENPEKRIRGMNMSDGIIDTVMNIEVFVFIGLLIWLYFKQVDDGDDSAD